MFILDKLPESLLLSFIFPKLTTHDLYTLVEALPGLERHVDCYQDWAAILNGNFPNLDVPPSIGYVRFYKTYKKLYAWGRASGDTGTTSLGMDCARISATTPCVLPSVTPAHQFWRVTVPCRVTAVTDAVEAVGDGFFLTVDGQIKHLMGKGYIQTLPSLYKQLRGIHGAAEAVDKSGAVRYFRWGDRVPDIGVPGRILGICDGYHSECAMLQKEGLFSYPAGADPVRDCDRETILSGDSVPGTGQTIVQIADCSDITSLPGGYTANNEWVMLFLTNYGNVFLMDPFRYTSLAGPPLSPNQRTRLESNSNKTRYCFSDSYKDFSSEHNPPRPRTLTYTDPKTGVQLYELPTNGIFFVYVLPFLIDIRVMVNVHQEAFILAGNSRAVPGQDLVFDETQQRLSFLGLTTDGDIHVLVFDTLKMFKIPEISQVTSIVANDNGNTAEPRYTCVYMLTQSGELFVLGHDVDSNCGLGCQGVTKFPCAGVENEPLNYLRHARDAQVVQPHPNWSGVRPYAFLPAKLEFPGRVEALSSSFRAMQAVVIEDYF